MATNFSISFALSPQVPSIHRHLVPSTFRLPAAILNASRCLGDLSSTSMVSRNLPPERRCSSVPRPPSQRAAIFEWREIRNADQRPTRSCAHLDLGPHRQACRQSESRQGKTIETSGRELREPLAALAHLASHTLAPLSRSEPGADLLLSTSRWAAVDADAAADRHRA